MMRDVRHLLTACVFLLSSQKAFSDGYCEYCGPPSPMFGEINISYDDFRGIPEGTWNGNTGGLIGANFGMTLFDLIGLQVGGSYGVYDWYGRGSVVPGIAGSVQQQGFVTAGLFHKASCCDGDDEIFCCNGIQAAAVVDWMFNKNFGVFALDPSFGQVRYQLSYIINGSQEFGVWGAADIHTAHKSVAGIPVSFRAISQVSLFWRSIFENRSELMLWGGVPYRKSLIVPGKREGQFVVGANFRAPFTDCLSLEAHGAYMGPVGNSSIRHFVNYDANVCIGITYSFPLRGNNCCNQARPYLPIANNSNFFVDTNLTD